MAIQLYKRANAKASPEKDSKDPSIQKWNAGAVCVKIDNEFIPVSELAKLAKIKKANAFERVQSVENEMEIDGESHDMGNLINLYRDSKQNMTDKEDPALQAAIKGMKKYDSKGNEIAGAKDDNEDVVLEKKNEDAGEEELEKGEEEGAKKVVAQKGKNKKNDSDEGFVKDTTKEGKKNEDDVEDKDEEKKDNEMDEEEEKENEFVSEKNPGKKNGKGNERDVRHFIRLNTARENGSAEAGVLTIDTMHNRVDRGTSRYGSAEQN